jgi:hypothetical protein
MYYTIVLVIAVILLVVALIFVGIMLTTRGKNIPYPDYQNACPDFWSVDGSICKPPQTDVNTPSPDKFIGSTPLIKHDGVKLDGKKVVSIDTSADNWANLCSKTSWAKSNGIFWDGVANTNQCS